MTKNRNLCDVLFFLKERRTLILGYLERNGETEPSGDGEPIVIGELVRSLWIVGIVAHGPVVAMGDIGAVHFRQRAHTVGVKRSVEDGQREV